MSSEQLAAELTDHLLRKYAEDVTDFADEDSDLTKKSDRSQKLRLALLGMGALGVGGLAAWGLSSEAAKDFGAWVGGPKPVPSMEAALSNPVSHGVAAGTLAAALRSGQAGKMFSKTTPTGESPGGRFHAVEPTMVERAGTRMSETGLLPQSTANRIAKDVTRLTAPTTDSKWYSNLFSLPVNPEAKALLDGTAPYVAASEKGPDAPGKDASPAEVKAWKADQPIIAGLSKKVDPLNFVNAMRQFERSNPAPMKASTSGLYIQQGESYVPISASGLAVDQIVDAAAKGKLIQTAIADDGTYTRSAFGTKPVDLADQIQVAKNRTVTDAAMTPARQIELFMLKQTTAPKLSEYVGQLRDLASRNPALQPLYEAVRGDLLNTHNVGIHAETGYLPNTNTTPSPNGDRTLNLVSKRMFDRASYLQTLQQAMHQNRYQAGPGKAAGRAIRTGTAVGALSFALQQALGASSGFYLGRDK